MVTRQEGTAGRGRPETGFRVWYTAALIVAVVTLQPALVYYVFGRLRDTLIAGLLSACCFGYLALNHQEAKRAWLRWPLLAYFALSLPGTAKAIAQGTIPYTWIMWVLAPVGLYLLAVETARSADAVLLLRRTVGLLALAEGALAATMMISTAGVGWLTVVSAGAYFDAEALRFNVWRYSSESPTSTLDPRLLFINGTFEHSGALSLFLALALPTILWLAARDRSAPWRRLWASTSFVSVVIIVFYFQRGVWLAAIAGMAVAALAHRRARRWLTVVLLLLTAALVLIPVFRTIVVERLTSSGTVIGRLENYRKAVALWTLHPLVGVGFGQYNYRIADVGGEALNPHNDYLLHLAEEGAIGLAVYLSLFAVAGSNLVRLRRLLGSGESDARFTTAMGLATVGVYMFSVASAPGQTGLSTFFILMALWEAENRRIARAATPELLRAAPSLALPTVTAT